MALQDLTPQLRTRLSRMERAVGWFVLLAVGLLLFGFCYYIYNTAETRGWFRTKAPFFTFTDRATGLKIGDPVKLMGLDVGQITFMETQAPESPYNIYVEFELKKPYYDYIWTEGSRAKVATADFLGKRVLEVTKGIGGHPAYVFEPLREIPADQAQSLLTDWSDWKFAEDIYDGTGTNLIIKALSKLTQEGLQQVANLGHKQLRVLDGRKGQQEKWMTAIWMDHEGRYEAYTKAHKAYWLKSDESAAVTERLETLVGDVEKALPNILGLTNMLIAVLSNSASLTSNLNVVAISARPLASNLAAATANLDHPGALGEWLLPTNINRQLEETLTHANSTLAGTDTNLTALAENLQRSLDNVANLTSNLNSQVQANTNLVTRLSDAIVHADQFVQGLKQHWLLRSAFKAKDTNAPAARPVGPLKAPKAKP